jgi:hypothetical protein
MWSDLEIWSWDSVCGSSHTHSLFKWGSTIRLVIEY